MSRFILFRGYTLSSYAGFIRQNNVKKKMCCRSYVQQSNLSRSFSGSSKMDALFEMCDIKSRTSTTLRILSSVVLSSLAILCFGIFIKRRRLAGVFAVDCSATLGEASIGPSASCVCEEIDESKHDITSPNDKEALKNAIKHARDIVKHTQLEAGAPGISICVSVDGHEVWKEGFGLADVENNTLCTPDTVMRIASISKPLAVVLLAKLWEENKVDLDKPVQEYVKNFPVKSYQGKPVVITARLLASHLGGIRHYDKLCGKSAEENERKEQDNNKTTTDNSKKPDEFSNKEYYLKKTFKTVADALELFKDDELCTVPGKDYLYTTHGYTLLSAMIEAAAGKRFEQLSEELFKELGMTCTYLEKPSPIIYNRARYYKRTKGHRLENCPYVDNSYKWAGGGYLSTVQDLVQFGHVMLYSHQQTEQTNPGYLKSKTVDMLWTPVVKPKPDDSQEIYYGMGWSIVPAVKSIGTTSDKPFYVYHTGGAVGASSVLLILPNNEVRDKPPRGVVVAMITNLQGIALHKQAFQIASVFQKCSRGT